MAKAAAAVDAAAVRVAARVVPGSSGRPAP